MPCPVRAAAVFVAATVFGSVAVAGDQASTAAQTPIVSRDAAGRVTLRAVRIDRAVHVDGQLDEPVYRQVSPAGNFVQFEPVAGSPATEATDVWLLFDDDTIYVSARCWDSAPESRWVINAIPRDSSAIINNENFTVLFDTFYDRRNAYLFEITAGGAIWDGQITNQRVPANQDWNAVWEGRVGRFDGGWTVEMAIPFRALRYPPGSDQVWGVNFRRIVRWKNEESLLTPIPAMTGSAIFQVSLAGTLTGLEVPSGSRTFEVKPYGISGVSTEVSDVTASSRVRADVGVDAKYGVTQNLTADLTVNTDFAQVEADEQQVNLTRFSLFFPEKREFFLEGQGIFEFGGAGSQGRNTPILFYSRRIGLEQGQVIPIVGGGRLTGKVGKVTVGLMDVYTDVEPRSGTRATNNAVMRVKRDILRRSSIGAIFTSRSVSARGPGASQTYGVDAAFGFRDNVLINTYFAQTRTPGTTGDDTSYLAQFDYTGDRYGLQAERLVVGGNFSPELGFVRRDDIQRNVASARFSPRPSSIEAVRRFSLQGTFTDISDLDGRLETRSSDLQFGVEFETSDRVTIGYLQQREVLERSFAIARGVAVPIGQYDFGGARASLNLGQQRMMSGTVTVEHGAFYGGDRTSAGFSRGQIKVSPLFSVEPAMSINWVNLPEGSFRTTVASTRLTYTFTPRMFLGGLLQYNSTNDSVGSNLRFRWEYLPGSELFVVYTDEWDAERLGRSSLRNRALVVKVNRLFRG